MFRIAHTVILTLLCSLLSLNTLSYGDVNQFRKLAGQISDAYQNKEFDKAKALLPQAMAETGVPPEQMAFVYEVKGSISKEEKAYPEAIAAYEKVVTLYQTVGYSEKSPEMLNMLMNVAMAYYSNHNHVKSESMLSSLIKNYKEKPNEDNYRFKVLYASLAYSQYKNDRVDEAIKTAEEGVYYLKARPKSTPEDWTSLQKVLTQYQDISSKNVFLSLVDQVKKARESSETEKALTLINTALNKNNFNEEDTGWVYQFKGILLSDEKNYTDAIEAYKKSKEFYQQAGFKSSDETITNTMANLAMMYYEIENYTETEAILTELIPLYTNNMGGSDPDITRFYWALAYSQYKNHQPEKAVNTVKEAINLFTTHDAFINKELSEFKALQKEFEEIAASKDEHYAKVLYKKGVNAFWNGHREEAEDYLTEALNKSLGKSGKISQLVLDIQELLAQTRELDSEEHYLNYIEKPYRRWHPKTKEIWIYIHPGNELNSWKPDYTNMVKKAFLAWEKALDGQIKMVFRDKEKPADTYVFWYEQMPPAGIAKKKHNNAFTTGENRTVTTEDVITENDIHIYLKHPSREVTADSLYSTILHEVGHLMGLTGHSPNPTDVMYGYSSSGLQDVMEPSLRDIKTLEFLYEEKRHIMTPKKVHISEYKKPKYAGNSGFVIKNDPMMRFW